MPLLEKKNFTEKWVGSDEKFNKLYPMPVRELARKHWTPLSVAQKAARFLAAEKNVRILDIGSGVGKFCLAAAQASPDAYYVGVEQRKHLIQHAQTARDMLGLQNVFFVHGNFTQLNFKLYDHFYFYNSFYENLAGTGKIDYSIDYSPELFSYYNRYLYRQLDQKAAGTRLVTYHSMEDEVPPDYHVVASEMENLLKYYIKI